MRVTIFSNLFDKNKRLSAHPECVNLRGKCAHQAVSKLPVMCSLLALQIPQDCRQIITESCRRHVGKVLRHRRTLAHLNGLLLSLSKKILQRPLLVQAMGRRSDKFVGSGWLHAPKTQAQRPGPRERSIATWMRRPGFAAVQA